VDDLRKMKFRAYGDPAEIMSRMGVPTVMLPGGELYESMQRGVIDAFEYSTASVCWKMGFHEVIDYLYIGTSRAPCDGAAIFANETSFANITPDLQEIVRKAVRPVLLGYYIEGLLDDVKALEDIKDYGVVVQPIPEEVDKAFMEEAAKYFDEKAAGDPFYARVVDSQKEFKRLMELVGVR